MPDRLPEYHLDPPEDRIFAVCDQCGGEIYEGETYYDIEGDYIHEDCFEEYAREEYADCRKEAECCGKMRW